MELKQLEYLTIAADMGSFNKASELLYTTQSNVSKVIAGLEKEVGFDIFRRQGGGVLLTDAGQILYDQAKEVLQMVKKMENNTAYAHKTCFHIASIYSNFLADQFSDFIIKYDNPQACFKMWDGNLSYVTELVISGEAELGFLYISDKQLNAFQKYLRKKGLYFKEIFPTGVELCVGPKHPYYNRQSVTLDEIKKLHYIRMFEDNYAKTFSLRPLEEMLGIDESESDAIEVGSSYALLNILSKTTRAHVYFGNLNRGQEDGIMNLRVIPVEGKNCSALFGYIHREDEPESKLAKEFVEQIKMSQGRNSEDDS